MRNRTLQHSNSVTAMFRDATTLAFDLARETTVGQLAQQIGQLADLHGGLLLPVKVRVSGSK